MNRPTRLSALLATLLAAASLAACNNRTDDGQTVGQKVDQTIAKADQATERAGAEAREAGRETKEAVGTAADRAGAQMTDASITTKVNMALAADDKLSALKIDVDTDHGKVALKGTAPDAASRDRATQLASAVDGVTGVDNQLRVEAR